MAHSISRVSSRSTPQRAKWPKALRLKPTVLLADIADFGAMNAVYAKYYTKDMPARVCYEVANLPMGALVEIETIAVK